MRWLAWSPRGIEGRSEVVRITVGAALIPASLAWPTSSFGLVVLFGGYLLAVLSVIEAGDREHRAWHAAWEAEFARRRADLA